jgi:hypothetical protein
MGEHVSPHEQPGVVAVLQLEYGMVEHAAALHDRPHEQPGAFAVVHDV